MQCESSPREEEIPSLFWGLDPVFVAFAKLYIRDILEMKESDQVPGVYFYNGHPIRRVDIMGTVVSLRERDAFYSYGVDDATGVINCICWKKLSDTESSSDKVDDPAWSIQIARMLELPALYKKVYDQPFRNPTLSEEEALNNKDTLDLDGLTLLLSEKVKEFLQENKVQTFYQQELEMVESLQSVASQPVAHGACSDQMELKNTTTCSVVHTVFKKAIQLLREKGLVFQRDGGSDKLYYVTSKDKELHQKIYQIIKEECQKPNHVEKGCHVMHVLSCVRLNLRWDLNRAVMQQVLELLEDQSDIVSTGDHYYTAF
ncbi:CST complex subunit STN1 isoform X2 [Meriones unguiculatus]|uniref:CST complex subunit STN1 isoform X2 n=1 Tax=Meriones unguiculatus TaxID=10047 RepID=UPI00293E5D8B|nr:CST complex subunit STN1 isoform X2 [Meriones unguiculatus]